MSDSIYHLYRIYSFFFFNDTATTEIYTLSLHDALPIEPIGTDWTKPHITDAPYVIVVFEQAHGWNDDGSKRKHYYVRESVGIAVGFLLASLHAAGLATLTHSPAPMGFLREVLERPENERPFILIPVGYPAEDAEVPDLTKKPLEEITVRL